MTIGPAKRTLIAEIMSSTNPKPKIFLEFGSYVGYSALALGSALRDLHPNAKPGEIKYYTFENMPYWAAITSSLVELAGLKDIVEVVVGDAAEGLKRLNAEGKLPKGSVDMMLLDHWERFYVPDLQVCEDLSILREGTVIFADNVLAPGAPDYLKYVQVGKAAKSKEELRYATKGIDSIMPNGWKVNPTFCASLRVNEADRLAGHSRGDDSREKLIGFYDERYFVRYYLCISRFVYARNERKLRS